VNTPFTVIVVLLSKIKASEADYVHDSYGNRFLVMGLIELPNQGGMPNPNKP
jgi:hypothetical protein